jgi:hypothetical protein
MIMLFGPVSAVWLGYKKGGGGGIDMVGQMVGIFVVWSAKLNQVCQHSVFGRSPDLSGEGLSWVSLQHHQHLVPSVATDFIHTCRIAM